MSAVTNPAGIAPAGFARLPKCSRCQRVSVLDPCRTCATPDELAKYPELPDRYRDVS
jgi:hypothetical protein